MGGSHTPSHGTREVLIIFAALSSSDPSDIHETINSLVEDKITCRVVGLAAQVAICTELCRKTNPGDTTAYGVAMHEFHFRELLMEATIPPVTRKAKSSVPSLLMMGFPSREVEKQASFCAWYVTLFSEIFDLGLLTLWGWWCGGIVMVSRRKGAIAARGAHLKSVHSPQIALPVG